MRTKRRVTFPDSVRRLSQQHSISMQEALKLYNDRMRAKARTDSDELYRFAKGLSNEIDQWRSNKQLLI